MCIGTFDLPRNPTEAGRTGIVIYISHFTNTEVEEYNFCICCILQIQKLSDLPDITSWTLNSKWKDQASSHDNHIHFPIYDSFTIPASNLSRR